MSVVAAFADGCRRALAAPAVLVGLAIVSALVPGPVRFVRGDLLLAFIDATTIDASNAMLGVTWTARWLLAFLLATFLLGGVLDRLARDRATASFGFFGACGMFFFRFLRLALCAVPLYALLFQVLWPAVVGFGAAALVGGALLVLVLNLCFDYARVRMVVEDRRSALGGLAAGVRFVRRHFVAALALTLLNAALIAGTWWLTAAFAVDRTFALYAALAARTLLRLVFMGSAIALFQSRLAHARYVARPLATWPESASAAGIRDQGSGIGERRA